MNRFRVKKDSEEAFEQVWLTRDTQLTKVPEIGHGETNSAQSFLVRNTSVSGLSGVRPSVRSIAPTYKQ